ncbi:MAG: class I SAM-dependent methyltransferase [Pseudomonadota bacterium]
MDKNNSQQDYFDGQAATWDDKQTTKDFKAIENILELAGVTAGDEVLDVGAGTGVLLPSLLRKKIKGYTAVDFSEGMAKVFNQKFSGKKYFVADYQKKIFPANSFDKIIIFNSFPHFTVPQTIFTLSFSYLRANGKLVIAHSLTRQGLNECHQKAGKEVQDDILLKSEDFIAYYQKAGFHKVSIQEDPFFFSQGSRLSL